MEESDKLKTYSMKEIAKHNNSESLWLLIDNGIYDVTKFLEEHPGGPEVMLEQAGKDATEPFNEVGHSTDAKDLMKEYKIGELSEEDRKDALKKNSNSGKCFAVAQLLLPIGVALLGVFVAYKLYTHYK